MAASVEYSPRFDHQAGSVNLAGYDSLGVNFYAPFREDDPIKFSRDDDVIPFDLALNSCPFPKDEAVARKQISLHVCINAKHTGGLQCSLKTNTLVQKACEFPTF